MKVPPGLILAVAIALLVSTVAIAERWRQGEWEIPAALLFGSPIAACVLVFLAYGQVRQELTGDAARHWVARIGPALVLVVACATMLLLRDRYLGDYSAVRGRIAPDGSRVTSVSWGKEGGRYVETINGRFKVELTEPQYREIMRKHQAPFLAGLIGFATLAASMSALSFSLTRRRDWDANQGNLVQGRPVCRIK